MLLCAVFTGAWAQTWGIQPAGVTVSPDMEDGDFVVGTVFYYIKNKDAESKGTAKWVSSTSDNGFSSTNNTENEQWAIYGSTSTGFQFVNRATKKAVTSNNAGVTNTSSNDFFVTGGLSCEGSLTDATSYFDFAAAKTSGYFVIAAHDFQNHHYTWSRNGNNGNLGAWYSAAGWNWIGWQGNNNGDNGCMFAFEEAETILPAATPYEVTFNKEYKYTSSNSNGDFRWQRAIVSLEVNGTTRDVKEYDPINSGAEYAAYRDLTETAVFRVNAGETFSVKMKIGSDDGKSWTNGYFYIDNDKDEQFTTDPNELYASRVVSGVVNDFNNYFQSLQSAPNELGSYRIRFVHGNSNNPKGGDGFTTNANAYRIIDATLIVDRAATSAEKDAARNILNKRGVGYPKETSDAYSTFESVLNSDNLSKLDLDAAIEAYMGSTDLDMPEYGKAYRIAFRQIDGTKKYIASYESMRTVSTDQADAAVFVAGDNRQSSSNYPYLFVDNDGRLIRYQNTTGTNLTEAGHDIQIGKTVAYVKDSEFTNVTATIEQAFGTVVLIASVNSNGSGRWQGITLDASMGRLTEKNWNDTKANFNEDYTAAVEFEEVAGYTTNKVTLKTPKIDDGNAYASIYLPYAVALPAGVTAYKVTETGTSSFHLEPIEGNLASETGAILVGEEASTKSLIPCGVKPDDQEDNLLEGVLETTSVSEFSNNIYVLNGGQDSGIGFFKLSSAANLSPYKAYYEDATGQGIQGYSFNFEEKIVTAIESIANENGMHEIFDLQGRRLHNVQKGLNIISGRKVIR